MISDGPSPPAVPRSGANATARLWLLAAAALIGLSGLLPAAARQALRYERAGIAAGQWWRLASAHLVHLGLMHALLNAAALVLIVWLAEPVRRPAEWAWLALASAATVDAGLFWLYPGVDWYLGASGALHGLFAGAAVLTVARADRARGLLMLGALTAKLAWELAGGSNPLLAASRAFPVLVESHWLGACGGLTAALAVLAGRRRL